MSNSIESREVGSKKDFLEKGSLTTAKKWCEDARSVLGFRFSGEANKLRKALNDTTKDLKKFEELSVFADNSEKLAKDLETYQSKFKESAWELERLTKLYKEYEQTKKAAGKRTKGKKRKQRKIEAEAAAKKMDEVKLKMESLVAQMQLDRNTLSSEVEKAENSESDALKKLKALPDYKEISAARKKWNSSRKTAKKLVATWQSKFDPPTALEISGELNSMLSDHNWLHVADANTAKDYQDAMSSFVTGWKARGQKYQEGKKAYNAAKKDAKHWMDLAATYLPDNESSGYRNRYFDGVNAANVNQFDVAGEKINPDFVESLKSAVEPKIEKRKIWQDIKSKQYEAIRQKVEALNIPEYREVALSGLAEVVALAESNKEYEKAVLQFPAIETETERIIAAAKHLLTKSNSLLNKCVEAKTKISSLTGDALTYASPLLLKIDSLTDAIMQRSVDEPYKQNKVPTESEIDGIYDDLVTKLSEIDQEADQWAVDGNVQAETSRLAASKDYKPLLEAMTLQIAKTRSAIFEYLALGNDPSPDPKNDPKEWNKNVDGAETYVSRRYRDIERGEEGDYDEIVQRLNADKTKLEEIVDPTISGLTSAAQSEIETARKALKDIIEPLGKELKGSRFANLLLAGNIRTPKWYESAKSDLELFKAIVDTDNKALLIEKAAEAKKIHDKIVAMLKDDAVAFLTGYGDFQLSYDLLKDRLSALKSRVNKKSVKAVLPKEQAKYGSKSGIIAALKTELREAGPGSMETDKVDWTKRVKDLEDEVKKEIFDLVEALAAAKKVCQQKLAVVKERLFGELVLSVKAKAGKAISPSNLPVMDEVQGCEGIMSVTKEVAGFKQLERRIDNLNTSITWLIEDGNKDNFAALLKLDSDADAEVMKNAEASMGFQARYRLALEHYNESYAELKKKDGVDKGEKDRIVGLHDAAAKLAKKKDWKNAAQKMDLASRMMTLLKNDPMGSGVTGRGRKHLNELDSRWKGGVKTLLDSVDVLEKAIKDSCEATPDVVSAAVASSFHNVVPVPFEKELPKRMFESEIIVLQADPPKKGRDEKLKDREKKKKYREKALVKVRQVKSLIASGPMYKSIVFSSNPWSKRSGNVNGLEVMRAINDLDLNIQRAVD